jgi:putative phage-type endonuclease
MTVKETIERHADAIADTDELDRTDWLDLRRKGLGGSDAAAVLGLNPWQTPYSVWANKTEQVEDSKPNMRMRCGQLLEPVVGTLFSEETGIEVDRFPYMLRSKQWPWMLVNLDFVAESPQAALEAKTTDARNAHQWITEEGDAKVPDSYLIQGQHELAVTGLDRVYFGALIGGNDFRVMEVRRDDYLIENLVEAERKFWEMVEDATPPAPDGSDVTTRAIKAMYPISTPGVQAELPEEALPILRALVSTKRDLKETEEIKNGYENQIKSLLGDAEIGVVNGQVVVSWKSSTVKAHWRNESIRRPLTVKL